MLTRTILLALAAAPPSLGQEPAPETPQGRPTAGYDEGFFLRAADGSYEFDIEGRLQVDLLENGRYRQPESDFELRRMRLELTGKLPGAARFHLEPNFMPEGVELEEAWLGFDFLHGDARLMLGRMKAPFELEERNPQANIDFARFSIVHQFAPAEDHGLFLYGRTPARRWNYEVAVYNGTGSSDTNSSKDVALRGVWHPFAGRTASSLEHFQLGAAFTLGSQDEEVAGEAIENESRLPVLVFAPGVRLDGDRRRLGLESAWYRGPWFAQAELVDVRQEMSSGAQADEIDFTGGYLTVSHVLTGEDKSFGPTRPERPFDFESGAGRGAWILAARYSDLSCDARLASGGYLVPDTFTERIRTASLGLNWVPSEHVILRTSFAHAWYSETVQLDRGRSDAENAVVVELQYTF